MLLTLSEHSPEPLRSQVARQVRSRILRGDLADGSTLPAAHSLARAHRVPALAVQQAYETLAREGLVELDRRRRRPGRRAVGGEAARARAGAAARRAQGARGTAEGARAGPRHPAPPAPARQRARPGVCRDRPLVPGPLRHRRPLRRHPARRRQRLGGGGGRRRQGVRGQPGDGVGEGDDAVRRRRALGRGHPRRAQPPPRRRARPPPVRRAGARPLRAGEPGGCCSPTPASPTRCWCGRGGPRWRSRRPARACRSGRGATSPTRWSPARSSPATACCCSPTASPRRAGPTAARSGSRRSRPALDGVGERDDAAGWLDRVLDRLLEATGPELDDDSTAVLLEALRFDRQKGDRP